MPHNNHKPDLSDETSSEVTFHTPTSSTSSSPYQSPNFSSQDGGAVPDLEDLNVNLLNSVEFSEEDVNSWRRITDAAIDPTFLREDLFQKGIVAISDQPHTDVSISQFPLGARKLGFTTLGERLKINKSRSQVTSSARIVSQLHLYTQGSNIKEHESAVSKIKEALPFDAKASDSPINIILDYYEHDLTKNQNLGVIVPEDRSDEVYFPFNFTDHLKSTQTGLYIYPWPSDASNGVKVKEELIDSFKGYTDFFTGSCLFGSTLQGVDQHDNSLVLIKANLKLHPGQVILRINHETGLQLHGITQLQELEKQISLAIQLSKEKETPSNIRFSYHLPGYDYLLIGAELYLKGHMTLEAFESFSYAVLKHQALYATLIGQISLKYNVPIKIVNPFEIVFNDLPDIESLNKRQARKQLGVKILEILKINPAEESTAIARSEQKIAENVRAEMNVVRNCLKLIVDKHRTDPNNTLASVWNDFIDCSENPIDTIKDLGHLGNTVMIGAIARDKPLHSVCAFHPVSEKHIFVQYGKYVKNKDKQSDPSWKTRYPLISCITIMDTVQPHSGAYTTNRGLTFYHNKRVGALINPNNGIGQKEKLIERAGENVAAIALSPSSPRNSR